MSFRELSRELTATVFGDHLAEPATYHSLTAGPVTLDPAAGQGVIIDEDAQVMDEGGVYSRQAMATLPSGLVKPRTGDWIEARGKRWSVERQEKDDGDELLLLLRPKL
jgi:hypothetical protein